MHDNILDKPVKYLHFVGPSPRGVYMFFEEERIRYIGQTNQSFYQRLPSGWIEVDRSKDINVNNLIWIEKALLKRTSP